MKLPIKILKTSTYESLIKKIKDAERSLETTKFALSNENKIIREKIRDAALDFSIKRCIIGEKGSGKTTFIKKHIIRYNSDYFYAGLDCSNLKK